MSREDLQKLVGGYATGTLTAEEREALFAAALEDQELFDMLAREQGLRDLLSDPTAKAELLATLAERPRRWHERILWLRPLAAAVAMAGIAVLAVVAWRQRTGSPPASAPRPAIAEVKPLATPLPSASPAAAAPPPAARQSAERRPEPKMQAQAGIASSAADQLSAVPAPPVSQPAKTRADASLAPPAAAPPGPAVTPANAPGALPNYFSLDGASSRTAVPPVASNAMFPTEAKKNVTQATLGGRAAGEAAPANPVVEVTAQTPLEIAVSAGASAQTLAVPAPALPVSNGGGRGGRGGASSGAVANTNLRAAAAGAGGGGGGGDSGEPAGALQLYNQASVQPMAAAAGFRPASLAMAQLAGPRVIALRYSYLRRNAEGESDLPNPADLKPGETLAIRFTPAADGYLRIVTRSGASLAAAPVMRLQPISLSIPEDAAPLTVTYSANPPSQAKQKAATPAPEPPVRETIAGITYVGLRTRSDEIRFTVEVK